MCLSVWGWTTPWLLSSHGCQSDVVQEQLDRHKICTQASYLYTYYHHHVADKPIKSGTEVLRMYVKVKKMAGGGEAIVMISKTATIEELKTKVKER